MTLRVGIGGAVLLAALVVNPLYACGLFQGRQPLEQRMARAVGGRWELRIDGDPAVRYLEITPSRVAPPPPTARAGLIAPAAACGHYSVVAPAAACITTWAMPLDATLVDGGAVAVGRGEFIEASHGQPELKLTVGDVRITATNYVGFFASLDGVPVTVGDPVLGDLAGTLTRPAP